MQEHYVHELIRQTTAKLKDFNLCKGRMKNFKVQFKKIANYLVDSGKEYSPDVVKGHLVQLRGEKERGNVSLHVFQDIRKCACLLEEYHTTGTLIWRSLPRWTTDMTVNPGFSETFKQFINVTEKTTKSPLTELRLHFIRRLLVFWAEKGKTDFSQIGPKDMSTFIISVSEKCKHSMGNVMAHLRTFARFLNDGNYGAIDFLPVLQLKVSKRHRLIFGFTADESKKIVASAYANVDSNKRNYAMMVLAQYTGLRGIDIINLKLSSIDWRKEEIRIIQSKTGTKLTLPLMPVVGNAISEYILAHRPKTNSEYVFVRHIAPYQKLGNKGAIGNIIRKHKRLAGIDASGQGRGFHAFRRSLGTWLLETETPLELIAQVFGQVDRDSAKSYLPMDTEKLRICSLSLEGLPLLEGRYV